MNLHMPQDLESEAELRNLAAVPYQIISPGNNSAIMGVFQDSLLGSYLFSRDGIKFNPREAMNLLMMLDTVNEKELNRLITENKTVSNFDLLSQIMPPLSMKYKTKAFNPDKSEKENYNTIIEILNGSFKRGQLDKSVLGGNTRGLLQRICNEFGNFASAKFIDDLQNIVTAYMKTAAFSVGVSDLMSNKKTDDEIVEVITRKKSDVKNLIDQTQIGVFENNTGKSNREEFELKVNNILNQATSESGKIGLKSLPKGNRFVTMVNAGSKGSDLNISFMISCLGQQNVDGKRIPYGFDSRTLPHFTKYDDSPGARGFVENSYVNGLSPQELFMHAQGGREGLIDTAVKSVTWDTRVIIVENKKPIYTEIGRWIDSKLDNPGLKSTIQYHGPEERNMELLNVDANEIFVPTTDEKGNISWQKVTAMTRHDPGTTLYEIKTKSGREVTVTESKSLLVWNSEKQGFFEILTPNIKIGDCVPVTAFLRQLPFTIEKSEVEAVDMATAFHKGEIENIDIEIIAYPPKFIYVFIQILETLSSLDNNPDYTYNARNQRNADILAMIYNRIGFAVTFDNNVLHIYAPDEKWRNDVVLDPIVQITPISTENNPKMYDLTIPTTLNFGLANGLQVRDTSTTGYMQRKLIKALEDLMVSYDMTIRNNKGKIVQFAYGDDGIDIVKVENQPVALVTMSVQEIYAHFNILEESDRSKSLSKVFLKNAMSRYRNQKSKMMELNQKYTDYIIQMRGEIVKNVFKNKGDSTVNFPVGFHYIINNVQGQMHLSASSLVDITPVELYELLEAFYDNLEKIHFAPPTALFKVLFFYNMSPKELLLVKRFNRNAIMVLLDAIHVAYKRALVSPGEMVGLLAGQSFGEVSTQLTLNSFHFAGVASKSNVTRGVPRIEEILSVSSNPRNPSLTVYLKPEDETNKDRAQSVMYMLEHTCLEEIVESIAIYFDPDDLNSLIEEDRGTIEQFRYFENMVKECAAISVNDEDDDANKKSKWIIRMEMDPEIMLEKNITMEDVSFTLRNTFGEDINCIYSDYNADKLVFRVRMNEILKNGIKTSKKKNAAIDQNDQIYVLKNLQDQILQKTVLRGIKGIGKVTMRRIKDNVVENNGVYVKQDIWVLDTMGTNMIDVMGVDYIDPYRTFSNDIVEVYKTLGIEAARQAIYNELVDVIEYDSTYINYHNYSVLIDRMTFTHKIISCFRHGINNDNTGPIAKGSFEETPEMFLKAARHAELDCMRGVSANIMCAQEGFFGTSSFQVVLNLEEMQKLHETSEYKDPVETLQIEPVPEDEKDNCSIQKLSMQNNVVSIRQTDMGDDNDEYNPGF